MPAFLTVTCKRVRDRSGILRTRRGEGSRYSGWPDGGGTEPARPKKILNVRF